MNRKVSTMPFYRLKEYVKCKALERGIAVIEVSELNTSKQCSRCGSMNAKRPSQGVFICKDCGYQINGDVNGAKNIMKRAMGYMLMVGAVVTRPNGERRINRAHSPPSCIRRMPSMEGGGHGLLVSNFFPATIPVISSTERQPQSRMASRTFCLPKSFTASR